jgi:hypothetical protein
MKNRMTRKLTLRTESLIILNPAQLRGVRGGTDLVTVDDPITAPPGDSDKGGVGQLTAYTCICRTR